MSRKTPEIGTPQFAALTATIIQLLGKKFDELSPRMVQRYLESGHEKLAKKLLAIFEPDADDWINAYCGLYQACGIIFDENLGEIVRNNFRPGWWPIIVQNDIGKDIIWACNGSMKLHIDDAVKEDVERAVTSSTTNQVVWVKAEKNVQTAEADPRHNYISLLHWLLLANALKSMTSEKLDDIAVNGTLLKANGGLVRAYYNVYPSSAFRIEAYDPNLCKASPRELFARPV